MSFRYGEDTLSPGIALDIVQGRQQGILGSAAAERAAACHAAIMEIARGDDAVYGINTGFGPLCDTRISWEDTEKLQYNILRSHSAGVGDVISSELAKLMLVLKVHALSFGYSGVSLRTIERIIWHIEHDAIPLVPSKGSVGASGDLAPLSHLFLPLIGYGKVFYANEVITARELFARTGLSPLSLGPKEGLALINGTQFIAAHGVLGLERMKYLLDHADIIGAMSLEALLGSVKPFAEQLHELRPYQGTKHVAMRLRMLLEDSEMVVSHAHCHRVQDPYSLRCMPQVHGAARNAWLHLKEMLCVELNSVTDNPVILDAGHSISGGNFHGQPLAIPLDYTTTAVSALGNISDRRTYLLLEGKEGLPRLLMKDIGINSGFMIPQYTSAALASENKNLCFPASADSIPTSLGQEDHVSMGSISGRKLNMVLDNLEHILAVELLSAAQAFDFRSPLKSSALLEACHDEVRRHIDHANEDRIFGDDLDVAVHLIRAHVLLKAADAAARAQSLNLEGEAHDLFGIY